MITLRKAGERHYVRRRGQESWGTFSPQNQADPIGGFGALRVFEEHRLEPSAIIARHPRHDTEMVTYVRKGMIATKDSAGALGLVHAGEFQRIIGKRGVGHRATKASPADGTQVFQMCLRLSAAKVHPSHEQKLVTAAGRRGKMCVVASPDGQRDSLHLHEDVVIYSALFGVGQHAVHELFPGRTAWLHVVLGKASVGDISLTTADSAGFTAERVISLTAWEETEFLLLDLCAESPNESADLTK